MRACTMCKCCEKSSRAQLRNLDSIVGFGLFRKTCSSVSGTRWVGCRLNVDIDLLLDDGAGALIFALFSFPGDRRVCDYEHYSIRLVVTVRGLRDLKNINIILIKR